MTAAGASLTEHGGRPSRCGDIEMTPETRIGGDGRVRPATSNTVPTPCTPLRKVERQPPLIATG